jgi:hypothetical protein
MVVEGILQNRTGNDTRTEYALADGVRLRSAPAIRIENAQPPNELKDVGGQPGQREPRPSHAAKEDREAKISGTKWIDVLRCLCIAEAPLSRREIAARTAKTMCQANNLLTRIKAAGYADHNGAKPLPEWAPTDNGRAFMLRAEGLPLHSFSPPVPEDAPESQSNDIANAPAASIPAVPMARKAADELAPIAPPPPASADVLATAVAIVHRSSFDDRVRDELGLHSRAEAVITDIEDLLGDACDGQLDHALIKALITANGAMQRAARRLAQG